MAFDFKKKLGDFFGSQFGGSEKGGVVGIDIGSSSIKVIQLKDSKGSAVLETYGELQLGPYAGVEIGRSTNLAPARLTEALTDIVREASVTSRNGALAVPYASSFVTVITLPTRNEEQLASMIPIEARKYVPVPISEVTLDWFAIPEAGGVPESEQQGNQNTRVLLAAIHNDALEKYRGAVSGANLLAGFTEIEIFSTIRSSVANQNDTAMILDIGAGTSKLYIVAGGVVQLTHSITKGGQDMTLALAQALELSVDDAEELKRQVGLGGNGEDQRIFQSIDFTLDQILRESKRFLERYERTSGKQVAHVILTGGGGTLRGLSQYTEEVLGRPAVLADPFAKVEYPAFLEDALKELGPSFAVSMGVALRRLRER